MPISADRSVRPLRSLNSRHVKLPSGRGRRIAGTVAAGFILSLLALLGRFLWLHEIQLRNERDQFADSLQVEQRTHLYAATDAIREQMDDPRSARELATTTRELAVARSLPTATIDRMHESLPTERALPDGSTVQLLHVQIEPPLLMAEIAIREPHGRFVSDLSRVDIEVVAAGNRLKRVAIVQIQQSAANQQIALLIDCSKSMAGAALDSARRVTAEFLQQVDASQQVQVRSFSNDVSILTPWTSDREILLASLSSLAADRGTALYQAMRETMDELRSRSGRRTLVLLTDGEDSTKQISPQSLIDFAREYDIQLHIVPFRTATDNPEILASFATASGGGLYPAADAQALSQAFRELRAKLGEPRYRVVALDAPDRSIPLTLYVGTLPGVRIEESATDP